VFFMGEREAPSTVIQVGGEARGVKSWVVVLGAALVGAGIAAGIGLYFGLKGPSPSFVPPFRSSQVDVKATPSILTAVRNLQRLQTTEVEVEKVVDVTDKQTTLFGLLDSKDNVLLVAHGKALVGIDLDKVGDDDITMDSSTGFARFRLPPPEVFSVSLDEDKTYVHKRDTDLTATRNEGLESRARKEASTAIEEAAHKPEVMARAKEQAEVTLRNLATKLGAKRVEFEWLATPRTKTAAPAER
jgi:hypothetical protein